MLQISTFHVNTPSLSINDEIRKTPGASLIRVKYSISKYRGIWDRPSVKSYYICGSRVSFSTNTPIREKVIQ